MSTLRAFVAMNLPAETKWALDRITSELSSRIITKAVKWVPAQNIHLTLRFLGETDEACLAELSANLDNITSQFLPMRLALGELNCFDNPRRPRVIWVGVDIIEGELADLQKKVEEMVQSMGWESESRRFHAHLTLGRAKDAATVARASLPWKQILERSQFDVSQVHLYESQLLPTGARYLIRHTSNLGGAVSVE